MLSESTVFKIRFLIFAFFSFFVVFYLLLFGLSYLRCTAYYIPLYFIKNNKKETDLGVIAIILGVIACFTKKSSSQR
jgi:hypothetical protein